MKKIRNFALLFITLFFNGFVFSTDFKSDFKPFHFEARPEAGIVADCSYLNTPITEKQRVYVGDDGHLYADGKRIRIFGTNLSAFPPVEDAEYWAKTLAAQGFNCIRFHHTDSSWANCFFDYNSNQFNALSDYRSKLDLQEISRRDGIDSSDCDKKLFWNSKSGYFIFSDDDVFVSVTMPGVGNKALDDLKKNSYAKAELSFVPSDDFACVCAVKLAQKDWLIFSSCWSGNSGEGLFEYGTKNKNSSKTVLTRDNVKLTTSYSGAGKLAVALGSEGELKVSGKGWKLNLLNGNGKLRETRKTLHLGSEAGSLWYELKN